MALIGERELAKDIFATQSPSTLFAIPTEKGRERERNGNFFTVELAKAREREEKNQ